MVQGTIQYISVVQLNDPEFVQNVEDSIGIDLEGFVAPSNPSQMCNLLREPSQSYPERSKGFRFYYPSHTTRIVETSHETFYALFLPHQMPNFLDENVVVIDQTVGDKGCLKRRDQLVKDGLESGGHNRRDDFDEDYMSVVMFFQEVLTKKGFNTLEDILFDDVPRTKGGDPLMKIFQTLDEGGDPLANT
ncbi:hypothetical protein RJ639_030386 [Escallonia herrerae]|uniref:Uncharacterized protein n=1 Tax=Escallonia herrerae TaxID=1293975 RepID=A0AA88X2S9_9ASTE|nr:hypothetical protein RJ639_030386 [Escallonia herrerae]